MERISEITYKNKTLYYFDYSSVGTSKEKTIQILNSAMEQYKNLPFNSVLALVNVTNLRFDMNIITAFKEVEKKTDPYEKKVAVFGMNDLQKIACDFISGLSNNKIKTFNSEIEAKEWLVED